MLVLFLYILCPLLYGLYQFSPPLYCLAELKQTKLLLPRFVMSLLYKRCLYQNLFKTFPCFQQLYSFRISILGSPLLSLVPRLTPLPPPLGLPPLGAPPRGSPLYRVISYIGEVGGKKISALVRYSICSYIAGSVCIYIQS